MQYAQHHRHPHACHVPSTTATTMHVIRQQTTPTTITHHIMWMYATLQVAPGANFSLTIQLSFYSGDADLEVRGGGGGG